MPGAIGFDIYGTLVDPLEMNEHLRPLVGDDLTDRFSELWRDKQIEYTFRRALMRRYENFGVCTRQALVYTASVLVPQAFSAWISPMKSRRGSSRSTRI